MNKLFSEIDEYFKLNLNPAFDRSRFSRRKNGERRLNSGAVLKPGQIVRSGSDRRKLPDRRRSWVRDSSGMVNEKTWES